MHTRSGQDHIACLVAVTAIDGFLQRREHADTRRLENGWNNGRRSILFTEGKHLQDHAET